MGKSTHFTGQPVYTQVINLLDKAKIKQLSRQTIGSEKYVKRLDGWTHLIIMLFGVLRHYDSLGRMHKSKMKYRSIFRYSADRIRVAVYHMDRCCAGRIKKEII